MSELMTEHFEALLSDLIAMIMKGKFVSKGQISRYLAENLESGSGEMFDRAVMGRSQLLESQVSNETDELKQAKAIRQQRALNMVLGAWEQVQQDFVATNSINQAVQQLLQADSQEGLELFLSVIDPNQKTSLNRDQLKQLGQQLQVAAPSHPEAEQYDLHRLGAGLLQALKCWSQLEPELLGWVYESARGSIGFGNVPGTSGPWASWERSVADEYFKGLLKNLALQQSARDWGAAQARVDLDEWLVMGLVLQWMQRGLIAWFDKQAYDPKSGPKLSISVYLSFTVLWYELAQGYGQASLLNGESRQRYENACRQVSLQLLRTFAQQPYFPLYGGIFASFSGGYLQMTMDYLDIPLKWVEGVQEKARILTLLGTSQQLMGQSEKAIAFHQEALELARDANDSPCEIANLNHLSRGAIANQEYEEAMNSAQRALLLSRQGGDLQGQANSLVNLGYAQVLQAQSALRPDPDIYELAMGYLQQGLTLAQRNGDRQSEALAQVSLGMSYRVQEDYSQAVRCLEKALDAINYLGDVSLRALTYYQLAESHYGLKHIEQSALYGSLATYMFHQMQSPQWRTVAGLLSVIQGQSPDKFQHALETYKPQILAVIGVDGWDYLPELLEEYRNS